jgi:hypothetical protein
MLEEIILSLYHGGRQYFYNEWKSMPEREFNHLLQHYDLSSIEKVIVVGAGAFPYTALFFSKHIKKPVYAIERNPIAYFVCSRLVRKLNITTIRVVKGLGQDFCDYEDSLVIIVLHTRLKQDVLRKVLSGRSIAVVRLPVEEAGHNFESAQLAGIKHTAVEHRTPSMVSVFIDNRGLQTERKTKQRVHHVEEP